ncbi:hypothetical protein ASPFODRAFT_65941 [Aspergillus luchuensis CBS 106.47]|uniref:Fatty acid desaturase domain-containing protein n=1 Tax=Aspergillus luchuensis (strain CBS 106.47) TaxID=1137211 RepID=A0A1M3T082_ASPLC|nr:hypothetical protein ASPFODRAFT_65941 [Aspergillus luchuensis CBS 106.47]
MPLASCSLTSADTVVLQSLLNDASIPATMSNYVMEKDKGSCQILSDMNNPSEAEFEPTVFTTLDLKSLQVPGWAQKVVRYPTDVVFLGHIILYLLTLVPSALYISYRFTPTRALLHWLLEIYSCGPFTLMLHDQIHNDGLLNHRYLWVDRLFPHNSYYYHHMTHHHVESNGPEDLSSTIRYQRDNLLEFLVYLSRFLLLQVFPVWNMFYLLHYLPIQYKFHATLVTLILLFVQTRIGMVVGNWGQHAFIDRGQPTSNYRSSITLIDVQHTSHHLNPRRHWREHPLAFLKGRGKYQAQDALVFQNIDFFRITFHLMRKAYDHLARCLVPIGYQTRRSKLELAPMLKERTRRFTGNDIDTKR